MDLDLKEPFATPTVIGAPVGKYSHLAATPPGHRLVQIAGQVGTLPDGSLAGPDVTTQTRQIFANIEALLGTLGVGPRELVKLTTFVSGRSCLPGFLTARDEVYDRWYPDGVYPAHSLAVVEGLALPELAVEIEGIAAVPE
ncbi:RidA family protein [Streptomyces barringtoniae]|uniref:RidA family protein n=1 Tax=Streptomyces barringtoniae TaxID=2892029 RepID=UPI001E34DB10|nr:RidA family protein [Streptomyces barringtoniae]MCC5476910.1 RidA family protein [Streptomyces barringtoniae]